MRRIAPCLALVLVIVLLGTWWVAAAPFGRFRGPANDPIFPRGSLDEDVVLVAIDDRSLARVGEGWPWSRSTLAALVDRLSAADVVVLDLLLADARSDDGVLATSVRRAGNVVLAASPLDVRAPARSGPLRTSAVVRPVPVLASAAAAVGSSLAIPDADGVVRRSPLVVEDDDGRILPSLAAAAVAVGSGADTAPVLRRPHDVQVGAQRWPTDDRFRVRVSWPSGLVSRSISASDVLDGAVDTRRLAGRTVYVGATAAALGDRWSAPVGGPGGIPGVATHAAVHHTLASGEFLVPASRAESALWLGALALVLVLAVRFLPLLAGVPVVVIACVGAVAAAYARSTSGTVVDVVDLALVPILAVPGAGVLRYGGESRERRRVTSLFSRYAPEPVVRELLRRGNASEAVAGRRLEVTLLFCDLRGFTAVAAERPPAEVNVILSEFYEQVTSVVHRHGGTIVQYVGDEVFAVFGAPLERPDHAAAALDAALEVQREVRLDVGFGTAVHSGAVVAGEAGSSSRRQYGVIGDPVNVASRLCGTARAGEVVVSQATLDAAGRPGEGERFVPVLRGIEREVVAWRIG